MEIKYADGTKLRVLIEANEVISSRQPFAERASRDIIPTYVSNGNFQVSPDGENNWTTMEITASTSIFQAGFYQPFFRVTEQATVSFIAI